MILIYCTGGVVKDQATADEETSLKDRGLTAISKNNAITSKSIATTFDKQINDKNHRLAVQFSWLD